MNDKTEKYTIYILTLLSAASLFSMNMIIPSIELIAEEFRVDNYSIGFSFILYMFVAAFLQLIIGPVSDRYGRRQVLLLGLGIYVLASIGCAVSSTEIQFRVFRILEASIVTASLYRAIAIDTFSPRDLPKVFSYTNMFMAVAPIVSASLGGYIADTLGWRFNFWINSTFGFVLLALVYMGLKEHRKSHLFSVDGYLENIKVMFKSMVFWSNTLIVSFSIGSFFIYVIGFPLIAKSIFHFTSLEIGFHIGLITLGFIFGSFVSAKISSIVNSYRIILLGRSIACISLALSTLLVIFLKDIDMEIFFISIIFVGIGNGISNPNATTIAMVSCKKMAGTASSIFGVVLALSGALFSWITISSLKVFPEITTILLLMLAASLCSLVIALWSASHNVNIGTR